VTAPRTARRTRGRDPLDGLAVPFHHGSHARLLHRIDPAAAEPAEMDAVIVPTCRPVGCLREAIRLAHGLGCRLVALCSRSASAVEAAALGAALEADVLAIDTTGLSPLPRLVTTGPPEDPRFARDSDLSLKRNLALRLARVAGWERVLFLDDDISGACPEQVRAAAGLLDRYPVVGLRNDDRRGFPDNSVVCHAYRAVGGGQDSFIGGGAVAVAPSRLDSFFPDIYNEDWFVFHSAVPVAVTGQVVHRPYDPFASPVRARAEEFGDCLAEGLFWLLDEHQREAPTEPDYWRRFLQHRREFINHVLDRLPYYNGKPEQRDRMIAAVAAAQRWNSFITPGACARYVAAWRADVERWHDHLAGLPTGLPLAKALSELGLEVRAFQSR
jgi:hypothetical protein